MSTSMTNREIANIFRDLALILEYMGKNPFKVNAYKNAYKSIINIREPVRNLHRRGNLKEIKGIGSIIEKKIDEIITTGKLEKHNRVLKEIDTETLDILRKVNVAPRVIRKLANFWKESHLEGKMTWRTLKDIYFSGRMKEAGVGVASIKKIETALRNQGLL